VNGSLNVEKTKVMLFGDSRDKVSVNICGEVLENVTCYKYLGVQVDQQLSFYFQLQLQADCAIAKTKRALVKVCNMIKGRKGISIPIALQLYSLTSLSRHILSEVYFWREARLAG